MARPLGNELASGLYYVTLRGDRREDIFLDVGDRLAWLELLGEVCQRFSCVCNAWCLMDNT
jgi:putative transposase